jgi:hypothetical protein
MNREVSMNEQQADRILELMEQVARRLDDVADKLDTIASNTGD